MSANHADNGGPPAPIRNPASISARGIESSAMRSKASDPVVATSPAMPAINSTAPRIWITANRRATA